MLCSSLRQLSTDQLLVFPRMKDDRMLLLVKEITNMGLGVIFNENRIISETKNVSCLITGHTSNL